jgi:predicted O-methyltransferase YrrM
MNLKSRLRDKLANLTANWMKHFAFDPKYYELWQSRGFHVSTVGFYSPLPDTSDLRDDLFVSEVPMIGIDIDLEAQCTLLNTFEIRFANEYRMFEGRSHAPETPLFYFGNVSFESVDAEILYCMVRNFKPRRIIEIGSGFSTLLTAEALSYNKSEGHEAEFTAIEPYPPEFLQKQLPHPVNLKATRVQDVPLDVFRQLGAGDILFIDSSHVVKIGSDTLYEFLQILPILAPGVIVHVHDIFLPREYPRSWVLGDYRAWNEQYVLQAFLSGNKDFSILWSGALMHYRYPEKLTAAFQSYDPAKNLPASFWMRRIRS